MNWCRKQNSNISSVSRLKAKVPQILRFEALQTNELVVIEQCFFVIASNDISLPKNIRNLNPNFEHTQTLVSSAVLRRFYARSSRTKRPAAMHHLAAAVAVCGGAELHPSRSQPQYCIRTLKVPARLKHS